MKWIALLLGAYVAYGAAMIVAHPTFIYPFGPDRFEAAGWDHDIVSDRSVAVAVSQGRDDVAVLYFMGNGGALAYFTPGLDAHVVSGRTVVAMQYPGGGGIEGTPSEAGLKADALEVYDWLRARHDGPIVVHGYSMGTGIALSVAAQRDVGAVVLDAPFVKMCEIMTRASYLPACYMPWVQKWNSAADVAQVLAPVLLQHGTDDQLIPISDGARLAELMDHAGIEVTFQRINGATHGNLAMQDGYGARIDRFLDAALQ